MPTIHLLIKGKVQGVFYRATAKEVAEELGLTGWIKNTKDGDVEIVATGDKDQLHQFAIWCKKGPSKAIVNEVQMTPQEDQVFDAFKIAR